MCSLDSRKNHAGNFPDVPHIRIRNLLGKGNRKECIKPLRLLQKFSKIPNMQSWSRGRKWVHLLFKRGGTQACEGCDCSPWVGQNPEASPNQTCQQNVTDGSSSKLLPLYPCLLMSSWLMFRARCQAYILGKDHPER